MSISPNQIHLSADQQQLVAQLAAQTGKPWTEVLSEALRAYRPSSANTGDESESFYDAANRLGLIGCLEGGPPDLSTNPKYMEGFGESEP
jgi:hypothetical protein